MLVFQHLAQRTVILEQVVRADSAWVELYARLSAAGPRRAAEFSWRKTAEATLEALRDAAGRLTP